MGERQQPKLARGLLERLEGTIQTLINNCPIPEQEGYNPYCECLHTNDGANALPSDITIRPKELAHEPMCEADIRRLILDEPTHIVDSLPRGMCQGDLKKRSYTTLDDSLFTCDTSASSEPATDEPLTEAPYDDATTAPSDPVTEAPSDDATTASTDPVTEAPSDEVTTSPSDPVTQSPSVLEVEEDDESFASQICVSMLLFFVLLF